MCSDIHMYMHTYEHTHTYTHTKKRWGAQYAASEAEMGCNPSKANAPGLHQVEGGKREPICNHGGKGLSQHPDSGLWLAGPGHNPSLILNHAACATCYNSYGKGIKMRMGGWMSKMVVGG